MPVTTKDATAELVGAVTVEEAETLAAWLRETPGARVGVRRLGALHTAALQALLPARPRVVGTPSDPFLSTHVLPLLQQRTHPSAEGSAP